MQYHVDAPPHSKAQASLSAYAPLSNTVILSTIQNVPVHREEWSNILEFICQYILGPVLVENDDDKIETRVCLTQPSPEQKDWPEAYKKDCDCNLMMNHLSTSNKPFPLEIISIVHRCFRAHLRANRVEILGKNLVCYIPLGLCIPLLYKQMKQ